MNRHTSPRGAAIVLLTSLAFACGGENAGGGTAGGAARAAAPVMGTFELDGQRQEFRLTRCDLTGNAPDGILLRGTGTMPDGSSLMPDGRRLSIEVERLAPGVGAAGMLYERTTVQYGSFMDEDGWELAATSMAGGRWSTSDGSLLDGPPIQVTGNELLVAGPYKHASRDARLPGTLKATCPAAVWP